MKEGSELDLNLLQKTELWINNIKLNNVNLNHLGKVVSDILKIDNQKVLVVDVRQNHLTLDILEENINQENIIGKEVEIIKALRNIEGVVVSDDTYIHSNGILGTICLKEDDYTDILNNINEMSNEIQNNISKRAIIFPTGFEVKNKQIEDTNSPFIKEELEKVGYKVLIGQVIEDDIDIATYKLSDAISQGYGLIITTGGVGAEDKDFSIEALLNVDGQAAIEYVVKFTKGTGRHVKDGVRIGVGSIGISKIIALPGPNDEVKIVLPTIIENLMNNSSKEILANRIANILSRKYIHSRNYHHNTN